MNATAIITNQYRPTEQIFNAMSTLVNNPDLAPYSVRVKVAAFTLDHGFAGEVDAVGEAVTRLKKGQKVFGFSELNDQQVVVTVNDDRLTLMPANTTYVQAAALAAPLITAHTLLSETGKITARQWLLIRNASGGTAHIVLQVAKAVGAYVIGTTNKAGAKLLWSLKTDQILDHPADNLREWAGIADIVITFPGEDQSALAHDLLRPGAQVLNGQIEPESPFRHKLEFGRMLVEDGSVKVHIAATLNRKDATSLNLMTLQQAHGQIVFTAD